MKKRRHHYVWRYYLRSWAQDEKIYCLREGKIFNPNLMGIGQKRDFYKISDLTEDDIYFINKLVIEPTYDHLHETNKKWVDLFCLISNMKQTLKNNNLNQAEFDTFIDEATYNFEEDLHGIIEDNSIKYLDLINNGDVSFYKANKDKINFSHFISVQMMRTEKVKTNIESNIKPVADRFPNFNYMRTWNVMSHILSTNMAWNLSTSNIPFSMILLTNKTKKEIITSDQPVINTYNKLDFSPPTDTELYYSVSPNHAILLSKKEDHAQSDNILLNEEDIMRFNQMMIDNSHSQIYAASKKTLEEYLH